MGLSQKPPKDKKPISREKLAKLLTPAQKPRIKAELPSLMEVPEQKPSIKIPEAIEPARAEGTFVPKKFAPGFTPSEVFDRTLDNTVGMVSSQMGVARPEKNTYEYNVIKDDIIKNKANLTTTQDEEGKPVFGLKTTASQDMSSGLNDFTKVAEKGIGYAIGDRNINIESLEDAFRKRFTTALPKVQNPILYTLGQMSKPLAQGITGAITGAALGGPYGAAGGFLGGALTTFALSAPEGVAVRYATELENSYLKAREEGNTKEQAYEKANRVAMAAAGGEVGMQVIYSTFGTPGQIGKNVSLGLPVIKGVSKPLLKESAKKGFAETASKFVNKSYKFTKPAIDFVKPGLFLGTEAALVTGATEMEAEKQGIPSDDVLEKAISNGSDFAVMDMAIRATLGIGAPVLGAAIKGTVSTAQEGIKFASYLKAQAKNLLQTSDSKVVREFVRAGEESGIYPAGSTNKLNSEVSAHAKAKEMSPKYPGDDLREGVVAGLTQKLNNLVDEQNKLAEVHKADLQGQIDDVKRRIEIAKTSKNPLEAELNEDGTPLILTDKTKDYATQESTGKVQETGTEGRVIEREGAVGEQQKEAVSQAKTDESGVSDSTIGSEGQVEQAPIVSLADKIRKFKIDESVLTGGDKGVAQTNIAGLPIAIYNASIEAIAKGVEAGGKLADLIEEQIKSLREGGYAFKEDKFRKNVSLIDRVSNEKSTAKAEAEMGGIKSNDYAYLQRIALEKYNEPSGIYKDLENLAKFLRDEMNKKMDTSDISDDVFEILAYDTVANEKQAPFVPSTAKRIPTGAEPETIVTNTKQVFKSMYTAATNVGKSVEERVMGAANMISEYIKKKDKLNIAPKDIAKAISRVVTSKMDSETAIEAFAENLSDIIENAKDANQIASNKATIKRIKKDAKSPTFSTVAIKETTDSIDFLSPAKIKDSVNPDNVAEVTITAAEKRKKYQELLNDYRNSITGNPTKSNRARLDLIDFIDGERRNFDEFNERKAVEKRTKAGAQYDKLVEEGKIKEDEVSREEFIDGIINPTKAVSDEVDEAITVAEVDKVEAYKEVVEGKRNELKKAFDDGDIDPDDLDDVKFLLDFPNYKDKVSTRNLKLIANIMEDVLNGERVSRVGDIKSDVQATDAINALKSKVDRIRDISKAKFSGAGRRLKQLFDKAYEGAKNYEDELSITNLMRGLTINDEATKFFRSIILGNFETMTNRVNDIAKDYTETLYKIFAKNSVDIDGGKMNLKGESILTDRNSQKLGIISALLNFENPLNTINSIIESTKILAGLKDSSYDSMISLRWQALKDLGIIDVVPKTLEEMNAISPISELDVNGSDILQNAMSTLNKRERLAIDYAIKQNKNIAPQLNKVSRNYFGSSIDTSNPNYIGMQTFFTDVTEDISEDLKKSIWDYKQVNKMRASSSMQRSKEMVSPLSSKRRVVHYDFDFFRVQPKKFHESMTTIMSTGETRKMAKMFARKDFQDFIKGYYNINSSDRGVLNDNMRVFKNIITEYVNGERKPYIVTKEINAQRSGFYRFMYSRMLNSLEAGLKQYAPNIPSMFIESPESYMKAMQVSVESLYNTEMKDALIQFLRSTSKADRTVGGFEALTKSAKSIADSDFTRISSNLYKKIDAIQGISLQLGDNLTTVQSLLTGYVKELVKKGKIKNASEFNIVEEVRRGLDQDALSAAETFLSFMNNESTTYAKAKIFRNDGAQWLRMLQSFSHNATTNFLIDIGRFNDELSNTADRAQALKRMTQYLFSVSGYGFATYYINDFKARMTRDALKSIGIIEDNEDLRKAVEQDKEKTKMLLTTGVLTDALLSRQIQPISEIVKGSAELAYQYSKKGQAERKEMMGEDIDGTTLSKEYSPFFEGQYLGPIGSFAKDIEKLYTGIQNWSESQDNTQYKNLLVPKQRETRDFLIWGDLLGVYSRNFKSLSSNTNKALRQGKITQLEKDAENYRVANSKVSDGDFTQYQIDQANKYLDDQKKLSKYPSEFDAYLNTKVKDFAEKNIQKDRILAGSKVFGESFSRDVLNIKAASPNKKIIILNNRFPNARLEDREKTPFPLQFLGQENMIKFMLDNKVITPEDYAMSLMFDKKGNPKSEADMGVLYFEAQKRYRDASRYLIGEKYAEGKGNIFEEPNVDIFSLKLKTERYMKGKVQE